MPLEGLTNPHGVRERSGITRPFLFILYECSRASLTLVAESRAVGWASWSAPRRDDRVGAMGRPRRPVIREAPGPWRQRPRRAKGSRRRPPRGGAGPGEGGTHRM